MSMIKHKGKDKHKKGDDHKKRKGISKREWKSWVKNGPKMGVKIMSDDNHGLEVFGNF